MASRTYVEFDAQQGYPTGQELYYECMQCHKVLPSIPEGNVWCDCYNLAIDIDAGRLAVKDKDLVKLIRVCD